MARPGFIQHHKLIRLARILKCPLPHALGYCECIWQASWSAGSPTLGDADDVESMAQWPGKQGQLTKALHDCGIQSGDGTRGAGLIEHIPGNATAYQVHDWHDHAPDFIMRRQLSEGERKKAKTCEVCGAEYRSTRRDSRFCSEACKSANHRNKTDRHGSATVRNGYATDNSDTPKSDETFRHGPQTSPDQPNPDQPNTTQPNPDHRNPSNGNGKHVGGGAGNLNFLAGLGGGENGQEARRTITNSAEYSKKLTALTEAGVSSTAADRIAKNPRVSSDLVETTVRDVRGWRRERRRGCSCQPVGTETGSIRGCRSAGTPGDARNPRENF